MRLTKKEEVECRALAGATRCPVVVVEGDQAPTFAGEEAHHTFRKSGTRVAYPGSAMRAGCKIDYHRSTRRVEVGKEFIRARRASVVRARLAKRFSEDTPDCVLADWLEDHDRLTEAALLRSLVAV